MIAAYAVLSGDDRDPTIALSTDLDATSAGTTIPIVLDYLAEGAANIILRLVPLPAAAGQPRLPQLDNKLLRLRKDKPSLAPSAQQYAHMSCRVLPHFPPDRVATHTLVTISAGLAVAVNDLLPTLTQRHASRLQDTVAIDTHALLVQDLCSIPPGITLEFKPKWLAQSPNAPKDAKRCRTCALRALRGIKTGFCPLALRGSESERTKAAEGILAINGMSWLLDGAEGLAGVLERDVKPVLDHLESLQTRLDPAGIAALEPGQLPSPDMLLAMTFRDCCVFVRIMSTFSEPAEVRLADLDAKLAHKSRVAKWLATETQLIQEGWYTNTGVSSAPETICILSTRP